MVKKECEKKKKHKHTVQVGEKIKEE